MDDELKGLVDAAYEKILKTTNKILSNCKFFTIEILQQEDPTYEVIAEQMTEVAEIIENLSGAFPGDPEGFQTACKAKEYAHSIIAIARAIRRGNEAELKRLTEELDRRPFL